MAYHSSLTYIHCRLKVKCKKGTTTTNSAQRLYGEETDLLQFTFDPCLENTSASWRKTYITNPPPGAVYVTLQVYAGQNRESIGVKTLDVYARSDDGITLGDVVDAARAQGPGMIRIKGYYEHFHRLSLNEVFNRLGRTDRRPGRLDGEFGQYGLDNMVIPSKDEWRSVK